MNQDSRGRRSVKPSPQGPKRPMPNGRTNQPGATGPHAGAKKPARRPVEGGAEPIDRAQPRTSRSPQPRTPQPGPAPIGTKQSVQTPVAAGNRRPPVARQRPPRPRGRFQPRVGDPAQRQRVVLVGVLVLLVVFAGRLVFIQGVEGPSLAATALKARVITGTLPASRGDIVDAEGTVLAASSQRFHIKVDQTLVADYKRFENKQLIGTGPSAAAEVLAPILGIDSPELAAQLVGQNRGKYLAKDVLPETWRAIRALNVRGIAAEETTIREYPNGNVGGNVVGFVNSEGLGTAGIEQVQDDALTGTPGSYSMERGLSGHQLPAGGQERTAALAGKNIQLSIISDLQWQAQDAIEDAKRKTGASYGSIVIEDVRTGEVLALAETDTVDPNDLGKSDPSTWGSRAVSDVFEPGSTAKVITMAAALETGTATPETQYVVPDRYRTANGQEFSDSVDHPDQKLTLAGIFSESSNTGTVKIGEAMTAQVRYDYLAKFGFGATTGIGLPGESSGILHPVESWDNRTKYTVLFGQGVSVNAIQSNQVFSTIGNGGLRVQPHLVRGYVDDSGAFTPNELPEPTRVVSKETAQAVLEMMETAVDDGTGTGARIPGYRVAGKTGTAEASEGGAYRHYVASFSGVAPVDDPRLAVSVSLKYPTLQYGGVVAAPVFADVTAFALQYLKVPPSESKAKEYKTTWE